MELPFIGLGTYGLQGQLCTEVVKQALDLGYRHIDTAHVYQNHQAICRAIEGVDRESLFLTSKISLEQLDVNNIEGSVKDACDLALKELQTDYLDLYLIHWPDRKLPLEKIFDAMEKLILDKKIQRAGVSNFTIHHLEDLSRAGYRPSVNQVEFHPLLYQRTLHDYCSLQHIQLIAYRPFGKGELLGISELKNIAKRYDRTVGQIILRWLIQKGIPTIPKASAKNHLEQNLAALEFYLSEQTMAEIDLLNQNKRFCMAAHPEFLY